MTSATSAPDEIAERPQEVQTMQVIFHRTHVRSAVRVYGTKFGNDRVYKQQQGHNFEL